VHDRGSFSIVISGGSVVKALCQLSQRRDVDFNKWTVGFVDERVVPWTHPDSNFGACRSLLLEQLSLCETKVVAIDPSIESSVDSARDYEERLKAALGTETLGFDVAVLGMGPDGHTASLFPGHNLLHYAGPSQVLSLEDSPKPPSRRITLSLDAINRSQHIIFIAARSAKAEVLRQILRPAVSSANIVPCWTVNDSDASQSRRLTITSNSSRFPAGMIRFGSLVY
jgi:6-phosphogluconolactonase